jgi:ATP-dependent protease ClpP protease subunit
MKHKYMQIEERKNLIKFLKRGDIKKIAELSGYNRVTVYRWINGESDNLIIEKLVVAISEKRKKQIEKSIKDLV